ncbi:1,2-diacylglycerol 3-glucosyltransferase [Candidatus Dependentiae bacterium Noda2021]|nr:1,2-diacylglycerol 3-glucosyltransferase [Candidatus Dependentiae bacterium Noda2021]
MRIAMITNNYTPYSGGVVSSLKAIVPELQAAGHDVVIITLDFNNDHTDDPCYVIRLKSCLTFMYKNNHMALPWRTTKQLYTILKQFNPDIVHVHHPFLLGVAALRVARALSKKVVFTYHTLYDAYAHYVPMIPQGLTQKCINLLVTSFCNKVDGIIVPTQGVKKFLPEPADKKCAVIPSPLQGDLSMSSFLPKAHNDTFHLLTVGRMVPEKNVSWLLDMFKGLDKSNVIFTLVGYGSSYEKLRSYAYEVLSLSSERVRFVHKPLKEHLVTYYQQADLFVFASQTDTQGLVLAESMAFSTPVIALDGIGQRDIIKNGHNGFIVDSADEMRHCIAKLARCKTTHTTLQMGAHCTSLNYQPALLSRQIIDFYARVLS